MKRFLILVLLAALLLSGCQRTEAPAADDGTEAPPVEQQQTQQPAAQENTQQPAVQEDAPEALVFTEEDMPRIDGSTATIPLSLGLWQALVGCTPEEADARVHHNTTHNAYLNLIDGNCDIIFVTPPSAEELSLMDEAEDEFEVVMVTRDAFVFLINSQNPVKSVRLDDLRAIYRGELTNWKQVGGEDRPIVAYQRPDNSGSQTLMYKLVVPADEIADAPTELKPGTMGGLVDAVSDYDGGAGALGYSVFYYATDMYIDEGSRLLAVDGVLPTAESIMSGEYPLSDGYYAVLRRDAAEDSPARRLLSFLLSPQGQQVAEQMGYVPLGK